MKSEKIDEPDAPRGEARDERAEDRAESQGKDAPSRAVKHRAEQKDKKSE